MQLTKKSIARAIHMHAFGAGACLLNEAGKCTGGFAAAACFLDVKLVDGDSKKVSGGGEVATATRLAAV